MFVSSFLAFNLLSQTLCDSSEDIDILSSTSFVGKDRKFLSKLDGAMPLVMDGINPVDMT